MPPPHRWTDYRPLGTVIPGTKFIAFKVPLKEALCRNLPEDESFSPSSLVKTLTECGQNLGLVVDLTFTSKYYNGSEFTQKSIGYKKIFTAGHEVPSENVFLRFEEIVDDFCAKNADNDFLIGVHCTHGVNRTGYLVCRYMIEKLNLQPDDAIAKFNEARGHPIERENYLADLKKRPFKSSPKDPGNFSSSSRGQKERKPRHNKRKIEASEEIHSKKHPSGIHPQPDSYKRISWETDRRQQTNKRHQDDQDKFSRSTSHVSPLDRIVESPEPFWRDIGQAGWRFQRHGIWSISGRVGPSGADLRDRPRAHPFGLTGNNSRFVRSCPSYDRSRACSQKETTWNSGSQGRLDVNTRNGWPYPPRFPQSNVQQLNPQDRRFATAEQEGHQAKSHQVALNRHHSPS